MLRDTEIPLNLVEGMDTKSDEKLAADLELLLNCTLVEKGTPRKRYGFSAISQDVLGSFPNISFIQKLDSFDNELLAWDKTAIYSWAPTNNTWVQRAQNAQASLDVERVYRNEGTQRLSELSSVEYSGFELITYRTNGTPGARLRDLSSGAFILSFTGTAGQNIRPIQFGTNIGFVVSKTTGEIDYYGITTGASAAINAPISLATGGDANALIDVTTNGTLMFLAYYVSATGNMSLKTFNTSIVNVTSAAFSPPFSFFTQGCLSLYWDPFNSYLWVFFCDDAPPGFTYRAYSFAVNSVLVTQKTMQTINTTSGLSDYFQNITAMATSASSLTVFYDNVFGAQNISNVIPLNITTNTYGANAGISYTSCLASHAFLYNGIPMVWIARGVNGAPDEANAAYFVVDMDLNIVARALRGRSTINESGTSEGVPRVLQSGNTFSTYLRELNVSVEDARFPTGKYTADKISLEFESLSNSKPLKMGVTFYYPGAIPMSYDGLNLYETGFNHGPYIDSASTAAGAVAAGTYQYKAVYEFYNNHGERVLSLPSLSFPITLGVPSTVTLNIQPYSLGKLRNRCVIRVFRTEANQDIFYSLGTIPSNDGTLLDAFVDNNTDAAIVENEPYPYSGDVLENEPPDPFDSFCMFKNRFVTVSKDRPNYIPYTKEKDFQLEPGFNEFLRFVIEDNNYSFQDVMKCVATMDDKLFVFKETSILVISGDGPNNLGEQDNFARPILLSADVGCSNPRSIAYCNLGLLFQSDKGIYMITRGLEVKYIGDKVEAYNSLTITSAILDDANNLVRFTTSTGVCLVFDYFYQKWSVFDNYVAQDSVLWKGTLAHAKLNGMVNVENGAFNDNGAFVKQQFITNWLKTTGIQDFGRLKRLSILGQYVSAHNLLLKVAYNYQEYYTTQYTLSPVTASEYNVVTKPADSALYTGTIDGVYRFRVHIEKQKCEAFKISIEDVDTGTQGESYQLSNLTMTVGKKKGIFKTPRQQQG